MKADRFTLTITLGNAAMKSRNDVARALRKVAKKIEDGRTEGSVQDDNGNTCGPWAFEIDTPPRCAKGD
jgi:hypothetical protein